MQTDHHRENWHETHANVVLLCRYLVDELDFNARELLRVIEEPWKWECEFRMSLIWEHAKNYPSFTRVAREGE